MHYHLCFLFVCILASPACGQGYDEFTSPLIEETLVETMVGETGTTGLVVDGTRTKIGRDFYEAFYQQWSNISLPTLPYPVGDSTQRGLPMPGTFNLGDYVITIDDLPLPGNGFTSSVSISVDDQILWQQFLPARRDIIEEYSTYAVAVIQAYFLELQSIQTQLNNEDQQGTGVY